MKRKLLAGLTTGVFVFGMLGMAHASLIGDQVTAEVQFGGSTAQGPSTAIVGAGVEFDFFNVDIDLGANSASFFNILTGEPISNETYLVTEIGPASLINSILITSSYFGLGTPPLISFGPTSLSVTLLAGTIISPGAYVNLDLSLQQPVPEPATMFLLGTGLVGVAGAARRKKKNQA